MTMIHQHIPSTMTRCHIISYLFMVLPIHYFSCLWRENNMVPAQSLRMYLTLFFHHKKPAFRCGRETEQRCRIEKELFKYDHLRGHPFGG